MTALATPCSFSPRVASIRIGVLLSLVLGACDSSNREARGLRTALTPGQEARLGPLRDLLGFNLRSIETWGLDQALRARTEGLLLELGEAEYAHYPGCSIGNRELAFFCDWNGPGEPDGSMPRALDFERPDHPFHVIGQFADCLRQHGIDFLVVPIPRRIQIYPDWLPDFPAQGTDFPGAGGATTRLLLALAERGVESIDLLPIFARERIASAADEDAHLFHAHNAHWTPRGARLAADAVAAYVRRLEWIPPPAARGGVDFFVRRERVEYQLPPHFPETKEPVSVWVDRVLGPDGEPALYRDRESPILLLGDSHSHWYGKELASDFGAQLYARLGVPIDTIVLNDGAAETVWANLVRRNNALAGKRVVVWMFTANVLVDERLRYVELFGG